MSDTVEIKIPDIGGATDVDVIEVFVKAGDTVAVDDSLITLEGDKATMEIPSPEAGVVEKLIVKVGDKVSEGSAILTMKAEGETAEKEEPKQETVKQEEKAPETAADTQQAAPAEKPAKEEVAVEAGDDENDLFYIGVHAGPGVRRMARELGVDLNQIQGSGPKSRIVKEDVQNFVKSRVQGGGGAGIAVAPARTIDFSKFGEVETKSLNKIKKLTGEHTHRSWVTVPHVTQFDEADITEMEAFRQAQKKQAEKQGFKLTPLVFIMKAVVNALKAYPQFNSSLDSSGTQIIMKKYYHIGIAADTPNGLVVPVIRDVDQKGLFELAKELGAISKKAREVGLSPAEMSGGCFTISSLGGIGGTAFTPIVNSPEVAILGLSKSQTKPVYKDGEFVPRLMLPLSLSYDHRVIDGAEGARFMVYLSNCLNDIRTLLL